MIPHPAFYGYHAPGYKPATPERPDIPAHVKRAAIEAGASHLSADGKTAYRLRFGKVDETYLKSGFDSWWVTSREGLPDGAVKLDE